MLCSPNAVARLQNCLALMAEVTAEVWLLCSDFRTAVPSPFLFLSTQKNTYWHCPCQRSPVVLQECPLFWVFILSWVPEGWMFTCAFHQIQSDHSLYSYSVGLRAAFWLVCPHCIIHLHCKIVSNIDWSWTSREPRSYTFIVVSSMTLSLSLFWNSSDSVRNKKYRIMFAQV